MTHDNPESLYEHYYTFPTEFKYYLITIKQ